MPMIMQFIPGMESYLEKLKKYKGEFERQERVNASLKKEIEASKMSINEQLDALQMRRNFDRLKAVHDMIPEEYRRQAVMSLKAQQQQRQPRERGAR